MNPSRSFPIEQDVRVKTSPRRGVSGRRILLYLIMIALVVLMVTPFAWMLSTSLKAQQYILETPPRLFPSPVTFESYTGLAERIDLARVVFNSAFVAAATTVGQIVISAMAAYAFARLVWRGRNLVFTLYLATMMVPSVVMVIPQFILIRQLGWVNTYAALIIPSLFNAFGTFLLRQSFLGLPKDFEEAAFVDGANPFTIFWRIMLPLNLPAIATLVVLSFMGSWNSYLFPLFVARKDEVITLPVALGVLQAGPRALTEWNLVMAGAVITVLPILIVYLMAQKWFIQGIVSSGIKG